MHADHVGAHEPAGQLDNTSIDALHEIGEMHLVFGLPREVACKLVARLNALKKIG